MISVDYSCHKLLAYVQREDVLCHIGSAYHTFPQITFTTVIVPIIGCGCKIAAQEVMLRLL